MPTYDYRCRACDHEFEHFQSMTSKVLRKCPECGKLQLQRLIGAGAGLLFKGSGFYITDYRSDSYKRCHGRPQTQDLEAPQAHPPLAPSPVGSVHGALCALRRGEPSAHGLPELWVLPLDPGLRSIVPTHLMAASTGLPGGGPGPDAPLPWGRLAPAHEDRC